jgi:hypothetical protein
MPVRHLDLCRLVEAAVQHRVEHLLLGRLPAHDRARHAAGVHAAAEVLVAVVLTVDITHAEEHLRMGRRDMEGLHERLLGDLPVGPVDLRRVALDVPVLERPVGEVVGEVAEEGLQVLAGRVGVDEDEPRPHPDSQLPEAEAVRRRSGGSPSATGRRRATRPGSR